MNTSLRVEEQLNVPPTFQPHGILLILAEPALTIEHISANVEDLLGVSARTVCGASLEVLIEPTAVQALVAELREAHLGAVNPRILVIHTASGHAQRFECTVARHEGGRVVVELEPLVGALEPPAAANLKGPIERLRAAPSVEALLASAVQDIREISGFDRALLYRLEPDRRAVVLAESAGPGLARGLSWRNGCRRGIA